LVGGEHTGQLHEPPFGALGAAYAAGGSEGGGHEGALLREALAREDGGDVFLLQLSGRQVVHAYQGPKLPQEAKGPEGPKSYTKLQADAAAARHQQENEGGAVLHARAQKGGGMVEEPDERAEERVEGMVVGEELDGRDMFTTLLRPGDTLYIPRGWAYESTTNTSFLESVCVCVCVCECECECECVGVCSIHISIYM